MSYILSPLGELEGQIFYHIRVSRMVIIISHLGVPEGHNYITFGCPGRSNILSPLGVPEGQIFYHLWVSRKVKYSITFGCPGMS